MIDANKVEAMLNIGNVIYLNEVDSTNNYAKLNTLNHGDVVISTNQTAGKGRLGRQWNTNGGVAVTVCVIPDSYILNIPILSLVFGTAVCEVMRESCGIDSMIKWPNDIVVNGKKLCGILTEAVTQNNKITKIVCGLGINVNNKFDDELKFKATTLSDETKALPDINQLIADIVNRFLQYGNRLPTSFKSLCVTIGKEVTVINCDNSYNGVAIDVTDDGSLVVKTLDGAIKTVSSGEVSVRGIYGYV